MKLFRAVAIGVAGGLIGAALMGRSHAFVSEIVGAAPPRGEDATQKAANRITRAFTGRKLSKSKKETGGQIVHLTFAMGMGALYGLLANSYPVVTKGAGLFFGAGLYLGAHALVAPALGLAPSPLKRSPAEESPEFFAHLVYGCSVDTVRRVLS